MKKTARIRHIFLIILTMGLSFSCKKNVDTPFFIQIETTDGQRLADKITIGHQEATHSFTLRTNGLWKIIATGSDISWLNIFPDFGKGDGSFSVYMEPNMTPSKREVKISAMVDGHELANFTMEQEAAPVDQSPPPGPIANVLDLLFKADGTAEDISPLHHPIATLAGAPMTTVYNPAFQRYVARFDHGSGTSGITSGFYKMDYRSNQNFKNALSNGHSLEAVFMLDLASPLPNVELKMLSSHQSGGTGLMIGNNANNNSIIFLPHVGSGYAWTNSQITPERGKYYHVIGVWDKQENKSLIYINGKLKASVNTSGNFNFPSATSNWFAIGADPSGANTAQTGWKGDVAIARVYDRPLEASDVEALWKQVENITPSPEEISLSGVVLPSKNVQPRAGYTIRGEGFAIGDKIKIVPISNTGTAHLLDGTATGNSFTVNIPANFTTGQYRFYVVRSGRDIDIGLARLTVVNELPAMPQIIAHRGHWTTGAPQNSIASLVRAQEIGVYGAEVDVWMTTDGVVVLYHDPTINGIRIDNATYGQIKDIMLSNGEKLPTLRDYLTQGKTDPSTKLILEIKTHSNATKNNQAATAVVNLVKEYDMKEQIEYIAFNLGICTKILEIQPNATVSYLNGDRAPGVLHNLGIKGIDYHVSVIRQNKDWITQAHNLGMFVNVWTVNTQNEILEMIGLGVDFVSTDYPTLAQQLINNY